MAGRPFVPTVVKAVRGTINTTRQNWSEPKVDARIPDPPEYLSEIEREAWEKFAGILGPMGVVASEDAVAFEMLAVTYAQHQRLAQALREAKSLVYAITSKGKSDDADEQRKQQLKMIRARPEMGLLADVDRRLLTLLGRFGLTPADRQRVSSTAGETPGDDPEDEFTR